MITNEEKKNMIFEIFEACQTELPFRLEKPDIRSKILGIRGIDYPCDVELLAWQELSKKKGTNPYFCLAFLLSLGFLHRIPHLLFSLHEIARKSAPFFVEIDKLVEQMREEKNVPARKKGTEK